MALWMEVLGEKAFFPLSVYANTADHGSDAEIRQHVRSKLTEWLNKAELSIHRIQNRSAGDNIEIYIELDISIGGFPASLVSAGIAKPGFGQHRATEGRVRIFLDSARDSSQERLVLNLKPTPPLGLPEQHVEVLEQNLPGVKKTIDVDWEDVVQVSIDAISLGDGRFRLVPETSNLSVFDMQWRLPGRPGTNESAPVFHFQPDQPYADIELSINGDDELTATKRLYANGRLTEVPGPGSPLSGNNSLNRRLTERTSSPSSSTPEATTTLKPAAKEALQNLIRIRSGSRFTQHLSRLQEDDILIVGRRRADLANPDAHYMVIINPVTQQVEAILSPSDGGSRTQIPGTRSISDDEISSTFQNMGALWFRFTE
jgi:hypothetical protein